MLIEQTPGTAVGPAQDGERTLALLAIALAALAAFITVQFGYHAGFASLNVWGARMPDGALQCLTYAGDSLFASAVTLSFARRHPQLLWTMLLSALIALLLSHGLKLLLASPRPPAVLDPQTLFVEGPRYRRNSFPSGHSVTAFVVASCFAAYLPSLRARLIGFVFAGAVALSRVLVGVHWPVDTLAGAALGCVSVLLGLRLASRWPWGGQGHGHRGVVGLLSVAALLLLLGSIPYPRAEPMARVVALAALLITAWNYLLPSRFRSVRERLIRRRLRIAGAI